MRSVLALILVAATAGCLSPQPYESGASQIDCYEWRHDWVEPGLFDKLPLNGTHGGFKVEFHGVPGHGWISTSRGTNDQFIALDVYDPGDGAHWQLQSRQHLDAGQVREALDAPFRALGIAPPEKIVQGPPTNCHFWNDGLEIHLQPDSTEPDFAPTDVTYVLMEWLDDTTAGEIVLEFNSTESIVFFGRIPVGTYWFDAMADGCHSMQKVVYRGGHQVETVGLDWRCK